MEAIIVSVTVNGAAHSELSQLATKLLIAAFGVIEGQPASAAKINVEWNDEDYTLGAVMVRDEEMFMRIVEMLNAAYGESHMKPTAMLLVSQLLKEMGMDPEELKRRLDDPPSSDPRMN